MADYLLERARVDLCVTVVGGPHEPVVWEHSCRVARLARALASLPEIPGDDIDHEALRAAALYHDMGWILRVQSGELSPEQLLLRPTPELFHDLAADWAQIHLEDVLPPGSLQAAVRSIRMIADRQSEQLESRILADADNLDQIGPQTVNLMVRKCRAEGKTLEDLVAGWRRQEEYHYWQARIKDGFHFAAARELAERRLQALRRFMTDLQASVELTDISPLEAGSSSRSGLSKANR